MNQNLIPLKLISLAGDKTLRGKVRLQKLVFLSQERIEGGTMFQFGPAPLGPLSDDLNGAINQLVGIGLIEEIVESTSSGNDVYCYHITKEGTLYLEAGKNAGSIPSSVDSVIESVYEEYGEMQYVELLDYIHDEYPEYKLGDLDF